MEYAYFPITLGQMGATIRYHDIDEGAFEAGGVRVIARYLNHPALALGYRLEADGVALVYATDHEPHSRHHQSSGPVHREDQRHIDFLSRADLIVHDAMYTEAEYPAKMSWGHSSATQAVDFAVAEGQVVDLEPVDGAMTPRTPAPARARAGTPAAGPRPTTILIADDEAVIVDLLTETLAASGFRLLCA